MYDYRKAICEDIRDYINENYSVEELEKALENREEFEEELNDSLWIEDSVTGNTSGSYTLNRKKAAEYVGENLDILAEICAEFGITAEEVGKKILENDFEYFDVTIRCGLLNECILTVLDEFSDEFSND